MFLCAFLCADIIRRFALKLMEEQEKEAERRRKALEEADAALGTLSFFHNLSLSLLCLCVYAGDLLT